MGGWVGGGGGGGWVGGGGGVRALGDQQQEILVLVFTQHVTGHEPPLAPGLLI